jgi:hypothetical protein
MKAQGGEGADVYTYSFLNLGARCGVGGQRHAPAVLPPGKSRHPLYRRLALKAIQISNETQTLITLIIQST